MTDVWNTLMVNGKCVHTIGENTKRARQIAAIRILGAAEYLVIESPGTSRPNSGFDLPAARGVFTTSIYPPCQAFGHIQFVPLHQHLLKKYPKIVAQLVVLQKRSSSTAGTFTIWLETEEQDFKEFHINREEYNQIEEGQYVTLEYAQHCKYLFKTDWRSNHSV